MRPWLRRRTGWSSFVGKVAPYISSPLKRRSRNLSGLRSTSETCRNRSGTWELLEISVPCTIGWVIAARAPRLRILRSGHVVLEALGVFER